MYLLWESPIPNCLRVWLLAISLNFVMGAVTPANADHALIVGVNHYPSLPHDAQLGGPVNDAQAIARKLKALGFTVTTLTDAQATKSGILAALDQMKTANTGSERFVFYFAGHGARPSEGSGVILASDASPVTKTNYLSKEELYAAVAAVPASGRTVLLDSCFSGAMQRALNLSKGLHPHRKSRYYDFFGLGANGSAHAKNVDRVNDNDDPSPVDQALPLTRAADAVCYFVAANPYQPAYEDDIEGKRDGLFTHYLLSRLHAHPGPWQAVQTDVTGNVMGRTEGTQTPCLTAGFASLAVFDGLRGAALAPPPHPQARTVWDAFSEDRKDAGQLLLEMTPNRSVVALKEQFQFQATIGSAGYLVLLELDTDGNLNLLSPASRNVQDAQVQAGAVVSVPGAGMAYTVDKEGAERVKAVLFSSEAAAQQLLASFPKSGTLTSWRAAQAHGIAPTDAHPFFTSAVGFVVSGSE